MAQMKRKAAGAPNTIPAYIRAAPSAGQPHLRKIYGILKRVAPDAQETIKWGTPFFVEPRFLFAFAAHKAHLSFAPLPAALEAFRKDLDEHKTTKNTLTVRYNEPFPEELVRKIAEYCLREVRKRETDSFW